MQRLEVSSAVWPVYGALGVKGLINTQRYVAEECISLYGMSSYYLLRDIIHVADYRY